MDLTGRHVALYGRLLGRPRDQVTETIIERGGSVERDLTRRTHLLVVGRGALGLIPSGHLSRKLDRAAMQNTPVIGENRLSELLAGKDAPAPTYPLIRVAPDLPANLAPMLNAFDLVHADASHCRFGDVDILRTAMSLLDEGHEMSSLVRILLKAQVAPAGRYRIVTDQGEARLNWGDAITALDGQGLLPLPEPPDLDDLFDAALLAEADGRLEDAARVYELCASIDRHDAIAPFNLANVLVRQGDVPAAVTRFSQAIARDPQFPDAYYNRARLWEELGDVARAREDLRSALSADPGYSEALFNLAQLELQSENFTEATTLFEQVLRHDSDTQRRSIAKKALALVDAVPTKL